jgi:hypothetical protein
MNITNPKKPMILVEVENDPKNVTALVNVFKEYIS